MSDATHDRPAATDPGASPERPAPGGALGTFLGMVIDRPEPGRATGTVTIGPDHHNPHGVAHGGVIYTVVDTAMGGAVMGRLEGQERWCATIELSIRYLRPVIEGTVTAEATVRHLGKRVAHVAADVHDEQGRLVALATGSFALLP